MRALTNVIGKNCCSSLLLSTRLPNPLLPSILLLMSFCGGGARGGVQGGARGGARGGVQGGTRGEVQGGGTTLCLEFHS